MSSLLRDFDAIPTGIPERPGPGEQADSFAARIAQEKCRRAAEQAPGAIVVAADTCANAEGAPEKIIGKPADRADAVRLLASLSGGNVRFRTALCMLDSRSAGRGARTRIVYAQMRLCALDEAVVSRYLDLEPDALGAAAALVADGLAPAICEHICEDEPGALSGLPMITLCAMLREAGVELP